MEAGVGEKAAEAGRPTADRFLSRHRLIVVAYVVVELALAVPFFAWAGPNAEHPEAIVSYLVVFLVIVALFMPLNTLNFSRFLAILHTDLDPQKMLDALSLVMKRRKGKGREWSAYAIYCAQCAQQLGYDDVALQWVEQAKQNPKLYAIYRILGCNVRASVARRSSDYEELARIRGQMEALIQTKKRTVRTGILRPHTRSRRLGMLQRGNRRDESNCGHTSPEAVA